MARKNQKNSPHISITALRPLGEDELSAVVGGRKAGGTQQEFLSYTVKDVLIGSY